MVANIVEIPMGQKVLIFTLLCCAVSRICSQEVKTKYGKVQGMPLISRNGTSFYVFKNIPYAKPPVGELRFQPPEEPEPWDNVHNGFLFFKKCVQKGVFSYNSALLPVAGEEDCLYLDVYSSMVDENANLPVMVWIHGGGFREGNKDDYNPFYLMDRNIVFVSMNYRLGVLGFLSTVDEIVPGNNGLKDQVAAIRWVKNNIKLFGGNPNQVTIFGESAGGAAVSAHLYSPLGKGLFHRAISQSGTVFSLWAIVPRELARRRFITLSILAGCPFTSNKKIVACLKRIPARELSTIELKFFTWDTEPVMPFSMVLEPNLEGAFITKNPWQSNVVNDVPYIIGFNSADGGVKTSKYLSDKKLMEEFSNHYQRLFPILFYYNLKTNDLDTMDKITDKILTYYFNKEKIGEHLGNELTKLHSDVFFIYDAIEAAKHHTQSLYIYVYDHHNENSFSQLFSGNDHDFGAVHGDEMISLFLTPFFSPIFYGDDLYVSQKLINYWVNFVYYGDPNGEANNVWMKTNSKELSFLEITSDVDIQVKEGLISPNTFGNTYNFWRNLGIHSSLHSETTVKDEL